MDPSTEQGSLDPAAQRDGMDAIEKQRHEGFMKAALEMVRPVTSFTRKAI